MEELSNAAVYALASHLVKDITAKSRQLGRRVKLFGIPRGGIPAAYAVMALVGPGSAIITDDPAAADIFIDDIVDSGKTRREWCQRYPNTSFYGLVDKTLSKATNDWIVFPWEGTPEKGVEDNILRLLQFVGENTQRGGLIETPARVARAWQDWCSGYSKSAADVLKVFEDGADNVDEMVTVRNIPFYSHCEHHMAPFFGTATIGYVPNGKIVGLSKLSRLLDIFAKRLQVQERMTNQIADALVEHLQPLGAGVLVRARHMCMESRGVAKQGSETVTTALRGAIRNSASARAEFLALG